MHRIEFSNHAKLRLKERAPHLSPDLILDLIQDKIDKQEYTLQENRSGYLVVADNITFAVDEKFSQVITVLNSIYNTKQKQLNIHVAAIQARHELNQALGRDKHGRTRRKRARR